MRLKFKARSIFILTKAYDFELIPKTREVTRWLLSKDRDVRHTVYLEQHLKDNKAFDLQGLLEEVRKEYVEAGEIGADAPIDVIAKRVRSWDEKMCHTRPHTFDFVITLGGDGTVLYASWLFQRIVPPVLSFSLGSLGFLTKFDFNEYEDTLTRAFNDGVTVSLRLRFEGTVMRTQKMRKQLGETGDIDEEEVYQKRDLIEELIGEEKENERTHKPDGTYEILNEIVIDRGPNPSKFSSIATSKHRNWIVLPTVFQQCLTPKSSEMTSTSLQSSQTASASPRQQAQQHTTSQRAGPSATPRTP